MVDISLLTPLHFIMMAAAFGITVVGCWLVVRMRPGFLQVSSRTKRPVYYVGGVLVVVILVLNSLVQGLTVAMLGLVLAGLLSYVAGRWDERVRLSPGWQLVWQIGIASVIVSCGWTIPYISHPWQEGLIWLDGVSVGPWIFPGSLIALIFIVTLINAYNFFDGVDGLAGSIGVVTFFTLAALSALPSTQDSFTVQLAFIGAGTLLGFLVWNWSPASVYLGTTGTWFLGTYLAITAMVGGGKIATTVLVLALPLLDALWVTIERYRQGSSLVKGDRHRHLHFRLLKRGFSSAHISLLLAGISGVLGILAVFVQTYHKIVVLLIGALLFVFASVTLLRSDTVYKS